MLDSGYPHIRGPLTQDPHTHSRVTVSHPRSACRGTYVFPNPSTAPSFVLSPGELAEGLGPILAF